MSLIMGLWGLWLLVGMGERVCVCAAVEILRIMREREVRNRKRVWIKKGEVGGKREWMYRARYVSVWLITKKKKEEKIVCRKGPGDMRFRR